MLVLQYARGPVLMSKGRRSWSLYGQTRSVAKLSSKKPFANFGYAYMSHFHYREHLYANVNNIHCRHTMLFLLVTAGNTTYELYDCSREVRGCIHSPSTYMVYLQITRQSRACEL